jgi:Subunit 17 of Mediator complex
MCVTRLTLSHFLSRITTQYGPTFASVTEDKLQSLVDDQKPDDVDMEDAAAKDEASRAATREELIKTLQYLPLIAVLTEELRSMSRLWPRTLYHSSCRRPDPQLEGHPCPLR